LRIEGESENRRGMARTFHRKFPESQFVVLIYPYATEIQGGRMKKHLEQRGINCLDYRGMCGDFAYDEWRTYMLGDAHPNPFTHRLVAQRLVDDLGIAAH